MVVAKRRSYRIRQRVEVSNESDNLPDLVIGQKITPRGHRRVSDSMLDDPEPFVIGI